MHPLLGMGWDGMGWDFVQIKIVVEICWRWARLHRIGHGLLEFVGLGRSPNWKAGGGGWWAPAMAVEESGEQSRAEQSGRGREIWCARQGYLL